jgi:hypothetical protein
MPTSIENEQIRLTSQVRHRAVGDEGVLVHLENGRVLVVNEVGLFIVQQLESVQNRHALAGKIAAEFEVSVEQALSDLDQYLSELEKEDVLEITPQPDTSIT